MCVELTIILKNAEKGKSFKIKHLIYEPIHLHTHPIDARLEELVKDAEKQFNDHIDDTILNFKWVL